jgi:hypothetical protein
MESDTDTSTCLFPTLDISFLNLPSPFHSSFPSPALVPSFNPSPTTSNPNNTRSRSRAWWKILSPISEERKDGARDNEMVEDGLSLMMRREVEREKIIARKKLGWEMVALGGVAFFLVGLVVVCSSGGAGGGGEGMGLRYPLIRRKG